MNNTINQSDLTHISRLLQPTREYTFFSSADVTFTNIDNMLDNRTSLNKLQRTEIRQSRISDHNVVELEIDNETTSRKSDYLEMKK